MALLGELSADHLDVVLIMLASCAPAVFLAPELKAQLADISPGREDEKIDTALRCLPRTFCKLMYVIHPEKKPECRNEFIPGPAVAWGRLPEEFRGAPRGQPGGWRAEWEEDGDGDEADACHAAAQRKANELRGS